MQQQPRCIGGIAATEAVKEGVLQAPLSGIRILDLSRVLAGPYCTMLLGDLGADVIKVEKPGIGDDTRSWGPPWVGKESAYYLSVNRNKRSICIDMKKPEGLDIMKQLVASSDVLIENYIPGKLDELGLGYEELCQLNPRLIYVTITGFGPSGPYARRGGYDSIAIALGGLMHITGPENGEPCRTGVAIIDLHTGLYAKGAILAALLQRVQTNRGQHIHCNLLATQVAVLTHIASNWLNCGMEAKRMGTSHPSLVPYQAFPTQGDAYIMIGAGNSKQFEDLCQKLDLKELLQDPRYADNSARVANRQSLIETLSNRFREKTLKEWLTAFESVSFPHGPINTIKEVFSDPQVLHNGMIQEMQHSTTGTIRLPGPAVTYSDSNTILRYPPPTLGEHTTEVLQKILQYDEEKINLLQSIKVIQ